MNAILQLDYSVLMSGFIKYLLHSSKPALFFMILLFVCVCLSLLWSLLFD